MRDLAKMIHQAAAEADDHQVQALFEGYLDGFVKQLWFLRAIGGCACAA